MPDDVIYKRNPPGDVQAFDVRSGKRMWSFHTIPQEGEYGNETWEDGSVVHGFHERLGSFHSRRETRLGLPASQHAQ